MMMMMVIIIMIIIIISIIIVINVLAYLFNYRLVYLLVIKFIESVTVSL